MKSTKVWHNRVKEDTTHAANRNGFSLPLACDTFLWVIVHAAIFITLVSLEADVAMLTPLGAPRILDDPVLVAVCLTIAHCCHGMVNDSVFTASVEDALLI